MSRGSQGSVGTRQGKVVTHCWYYGRKGHTESECWRKQANLEKNSSIRGDVDRCNRSYYPKGSRLSGMGPTLVLKLKANKMGV